MEISLIEEFKNCKREDFPNYETKDYHSIYSILDNGFNSQIHSEVNKKMIEIESGSFFNDHGVEHIKMVTKRVSMILTFFYQKTQLKLNPYELFILLISIHIHDTGHLIGSREEHARKGKELLARFDKGNLLSTPEQRIIGDIAKSHGGKDNPIGKLDEEFSYGGKKIRTRLLAALLRLGDELAEDESRTSRFMINETLIKETSAIFHLYSKSIFDTSIADNQINLCYSISEEDVKKQFQKPSMEKVYLIDEIYERTLKVFTESVYCSRFFPENTRITSVKVKIDILNKYNDYSVEPIKYIISEIGYPQFGKDIFEICSNLMDGDTKKDGKYYNNLINN